MNDSTVRLSADTSALTDSLSKIADEMTAMKDAVSSSATAMGANFDASTKRQRLPMPLLIYLQQITTFQTNFRHMLFCNFFSQQKQIAIIEDRVKCVFANL